MTEPDRDQKAANPGSQQAQFDGGCLGCLFVVMLPAAAICLIAAFDSQLLANLAGTETRRNLFAAMAPLQFGRVNIGAAMLAGVVAWEAVRAARRFINRDAVWIDGDIIRFHPTVRRRPLRLQDLEEITHETGEIKSVLRLRPASGKRIMIPMVDHDAATAFVAEVQHAKAAQTFG